MNTQSAPTQEGINKYYSAKDIAQFFSVTVKTVRAWKFRKQMPQPDIQTPRFTRWKESTIKPFLDNPIEWKKGNKGE